MKLTVAVTERDRPNQFRDVQVAGPFVELAHDHRFESTNGRTRVRDSFSSRSPAGPLGRAVDAMVLERYLRGLLKRRTRRLAAVAEGDDWQRFVE